jgi:transcription elongation factor GreA
VLPTIEKGRSALHERNVLSLLNFFQLIKSIYYIGRPALMSGTSFIFCLNLNFKNTRKMANKISYMTREGYEKLKSDLDELKTVERQKIARQIAEAREKGDLSENAEYDAAKEAQGLLELKIKQMEEVLANARTINEADLDSSKVVILTTVKLKNLKTKKTVEYTLVSETEADLKTGKISVNSPIGQGLLGKSKGDLADIQTPGGSIQFEILDISINL